MAGLFSSASMALGYARSRPPLHERIVALAGLPRCSRALDIGCGSGLSTRALAGTAASSVGIEPVEAMVQVAAQVAPAASFVHGRAEALPFAARTFELLAAAGSLNYIDLDLFFPEARRVLAPNGLLFVYDFSQPLDDRFRDFKTRYPPPPGHARKLDPGILSALPSGFRLTRSQSFEIPLTMSPAAYVDYAMTETNVAHAIAQGTTEAEIRRWCSESFHATPPDIFFPGYFVVLAVSKTS
jgi:SAM-dependent methyltransferase